LRISRPKIHVWGQHGDLMGNEGYPPSAPALLPSLPVWHAGPARQTACTAPAASRGTFAAGGGGRSRQVRSTVICARRFQEMHPARPTVLVASTRWSSVATATRISWCRQSTPIAAPVFWFSGEWTPGRPPSRRPLAAMAPDWSSGGRHRHDVATVRNPVLPIDESGVLEERAALRYRLQ
jgi:hypothetical protein